MATPTAEGRQDLLSMANSLLQFSEAMTSLQDVVELVKQTANHARAEILRVLETQRNHEERISRLERHTDIGNRPTPLPPAGPLSEDNAAVRPTRAPVAKDFGELPYLSESGDPLPDET